MVNKLFPRRLIVWLLCFICIVMNLSPASAQKKVEQVKYSSFGKSQVLVLDVAFPLGNFSNTHWAGSGLYFEYAKLRLVPLKAPAMKHFGLSLQGGFMFYAGKHEKNNDYSYHYPGYGVFYIYPGIIFNRDLKFQACLNAGPSISYYNKRTTFQFGWSLATRYAVSHKISVGPHVHFTKEKGSRPLCAVGVQTAWAIH